MIRSINEASVGRPWEKRFSGWVHGRALRVRFAVGRRVQVDVALLDEAVPQAASVGDLYPTRHPITLVYASFCLCTSCAQHAMRSWCTQQLPMHPISNTPCAQRQAMPLSTRCALNSTSSPQERVMPSISNTSCHQSTTHHARNNK